MSENDSVENELSGYNEFGEAFNQDEDKLRQFDEKFKNIGKDPIEVYKNTRLRGQNITEDRITHKLTLIDKWKRHMGQYGRHTACPSTKHAGEFIDHLIEQNLSGQYILEILRTIRNMFDYWGDHPNMPHGTGNAMGYNPVETAMTFKEDKIKSQTSNQKKPMPRISVEELGHRLRNVKNLLHRSVITMEFKYGSRVGQVCNTQIPEVKIEHEELNDLYPLLGTHHRLRDFDDDVIYFPPQDERPGVKSERPIVMPIDREMRRLLIKYLRQRPPVDSSWLFITNANWNQLRPDYVNDSMWKPVFHPEYSETEEFRSVTTHYARHRFATYWRKEVGINRELLKYMRGDKQDGGKDSEALDTYVHSYYQDIKDPYLSKIYKFNI